MNSPNHARCVSVLHAFVLAVEVFERSVVPRPAAARTNGRPWHSSRTSANYDNRGSIHQANCRRLEQIATDRRPGCVLPVANLDRPLLDGNHLTSPVARLEEIVQPEALRLIASYDRSADSSIWQHDRPAEASTATRTRRPRCVSTHENTAVLNSASKRRTGHPDFGRPTETVSQDHVDRELLRKHRYSTAQAF